MNEFLSWALLMFTSIVAMAGLGFLTYQLDRRYERKGLRSCAFMFAVFFFAIAWIGFQMAGFLENRELSTSISIVVTVVVVAALFFGAVKLMLSPGFQGTLLAFEEQGWFHAVPFKPNQGKKVRRATLVGILGLGIWGLIALMGSRTLGTSRHESNDWVWWIPYTSFPQIDKDGTLSGRVYALAVPLLYRVEWMVPLLLFLVLIWFAWRVVNWPLFADFLIATEAEINKVSWTTRKRLIQDTIVVLVTVILLTTFLFIVDLFWIDFLGRVGVLRVNVREAQQKQQEKSLW